MGITNINVKYNGYLIEGKSSSDTYSFSDSVAVSYTATAPEKASYLGISFLVKIDNVWKNIHTYETIISELQNNVINYSVNDAINLAGLDLSDKDVIWRVIAYERIDQKITTLYNEQIYYMRKGFVEPITYNNLTNINVTQDDKVYKYIDKIFRVDYPTNTSYSKVEITGTFSSNDENIIITPKVKTTPHPTGKTINNIDFSDVFYVSPNTKIKVVFKFYDSIGYLFKEWIIYVSQIPTLPIDNNTRIFCNESPIQLSSWNNSDIELIIPLGKGVQVKDINDFINLYGIEEINLNFGSIFNINDNINRRWVKKEQIKGKDYELILNDDISCFASRLDTHWFFQCYKDDVLYEQYRCSITDASRVMIDGVLQVPPFESTTPVQRTLSLTNIDNLIKYSFVSDNPNINTIITIYSKDLNNTKNIRIENNELIISIDRNNEFIFNQDYADIYTYLLYECTAQVEFVNIYQHKYSTAFTNFEVVVETLIKQNISFENTLNVREYTINILEEGLVTINGLNTTSGKALIIHVSSPNSGEIVYTCRFDQIPSNAISINGVLHYPGEQFSCFPMDVIKISKMNSITIKRPDFIDRSELTYKYNKTCEKFDINKHTLVPGVQLQIPIKFITNRKLLNNDDISIYLYRYDTYGEESSLDPIVVKGGKITYEGASNGNYNYSLTLISNEIPYIEPYKNITDLQAMGWKVVIHLGRHTYESEEFKTYKYNFYESKYELSDCLFEPALDNEFAGSIKVKLWQKWVPEVITTGEHRPTMQLETTALVSESLEKKVDDTTFIIQPESNTPTHVTVMNFGKGGGSTNINQLYTTLAASGSRNTNKLLRYKATSRDPFTNLGLFYDVDDMYFYRNNEQVDMKLPDIKLSTDDDTYLILFSTSERNQYMTHIIQYETTKYSLQKLNVTITIEETLQLKSKDFYLCNGMNIENNDNTIKRYYRYEFLNIPSNTPTISYRKNQIGINTKQLDENVLPDVCIGNKQNNIDTSSIRIISNSKILMDIDKEDKLTKLDFPFIDIIADPNSGILKFYENSEGGMIVFNIREGTMMAGKSKDGKELDPA